MQFQMAFVNSEKQFTLGNFYQNQEASFKVIDLESLNQTAVDCLILENPSFQDEYISSKINSAQHVYPMRHMETSAQDPTPFEKWDYQEASRYFNKYRDSWLLKNNLHLLREIFPTAQHLKSLWPNDRTAFFEELWSILRNNLNAKKLTIIFNDMKKATKEHEKNRLKQVKVEGTITPNPTDAGEFEMQAMEHYRDSITSSFEIVSYDQTKGEIVMTAKIQKSPVLIFAEIFNITKLQETMISSLFSGLQ